MVNNTKLPAKGTRIWRNLRIAVGFPPDLFNTINKRAALHARPFSHEVIVLIRVGLTTLGTAAGEYKK